MSCYNLEEQFPNTILPQLISITTDKHISNNEYSIVSVVCIASSIIIYIYVMNIIKLMYQNMLKGKKQKSKKSNQPQ